MSRIKYVSTSDNFRRSLGARIKKALRGRPHSWLAQRLGMKREASVSEWVTGKVCPMSDTLLRIAEILGCNPGWLLAGDDGMKAFQDSIKTGWIDIEAWEEIRPLIPILAEIYAAREDPDPEIAKAWEWITGNLRMFRRGLHGKPPGGAVVDSPQAGGVQEGAGETTERKNPAA